MSTSAVVKVKKVDHKGVRDFFRTMLMIDESVYFTLDSSSVATAMYTPNKDTAMLRSIPAAGFMDVQSPLASPVRIALYKGNAPRFLKYLDSFDQDATSATIHTAVHRSDGHVYATKIDLRDEKLRMTVHCMDPAMGFVAMTAEQSGRAFSDPASIYEFDLPKDELSKLVKLTSLVQEDTKLVSLKCEGGEVRATCDLFDLVLAKSRGATAAKDSLLFKQFFERIPFEGYAVRVYKNKMVMSSSSSDVRLAINLAIQP